MKKLYQITYRLLLTLALVSLALPVWASSEREKWYSERRAKIERVVSDPTEKNIDDLMDCFHSMAFHLKGASQGFLALREEMRQVLAAIPTLPDQLHERILKARAEQQARTTQELRDGAYFLTVQNVVPYFYVLADLKTPASVRVLGELLTDHRGAFDHDSYKGGGDIRAGIVVRTSNSQYAVQALMGSALEGKPLVIPYSQEKKATLEEIAPWQKWYERIKAGNATFRFEGDSTEYDLDGPAPPEKLARIRADRQRDEAREDRRNIVAAQTGGTVSNTNPPSPGTSGGFPWPGMAAGAAAVVAALAWYFLLRRKSHAG
jgi:hypothetical protein